MPASFLLATVGGLIIGTASSLLFLLLGRICGVSGIVGTLLEARPGDRGWRLAFVAGLLAGGAAVGGAGRDLLAGASEQTIGASVVAGLFVGVGTRMSGGCTSGHGLCGVARFSKRSIVATCVFVVAGAVTVFLARHVISKAAV